MSAQRLDTYTLRLARRFDAEPERVFRAWTDPEELKKWWGPGLFSVPSAEVDLRPGGRFRIVMQPPDRPSHVLSGVYLEVVPPSRLVYSWLWEGTPEDDGPESLVTIEFRAVDGGTEVALTQERLLSQRARDEHEAGWLGSLDKLAALLERRTVA